MLHNHEKPTPPVLPPVEHPHPERPDHPTPPAPPKPPEKPDRPDKPGMPTEPVTIIVNGMDKVLPAGTTQISYDEVVRLVFGANSTSSNTIYTVVFSNGPIENRKGTMVKGSIVHVKKGMIFNVGCSNKS